MSGDLQKAGFRDWRWLAAVVVVAYAALLVIGLPMLKIGSEKQLLQGVGVAALDHPFMDLRGVAAWCDAWKEGKDPAVVETWIKIPGNAEKYPNFLMNYSPLVLVLGMLGKGGLSTETIFPWAVTLTLFYALSLWILCGRCSLKLALFWVLLLCSPISLLLVERCNLDLLLVTLLVIALLLRKYPWMESCVLLGASALKFFPIVSLLALWRDGKRKERVIVIFSFIAFIIFILFLHSRLAAIGGSLTGQYQTAFGSTVIADLALHAGIISGRESEVLPHFLKLIALIGLGGSFLAGIFIFRSQAFPAVSERSLHAFFLTAPIMLGLFILGSEMDYKWIFFLFMVPASWELGKSKFEREALAARSWLVTMTLYSYWTFFSDEGSFRNALLKQVMMWFVMLLSAYLAGRLWSQKKAPALNSQ